MLLVRVRASRATSRQRALVLAGFTLVVVAHVGTSVRGEAPPASSSDTILSAIERLESVHDAKCHSTASRFEDFLFGTPLSDAARIAHEEAKRRVALGLWSSASRRAREAGDSILERRHIDREATELAVPTQQEDGRIRVTLADGSPLPRFDRDELSRVL